jgi:hypothetical protein
MKKPSARLGLRVATVRCLALEDVGGGQRQRAPTPANTCDVERLSAGCPTTNSVIVTACG